MFFSKYIVKKPWQAGSESFYFVLHKISKSFGYVPALNISKNFISHLDWTNYRYRVIACSLSIFVIYFWILFSKYAAISSDDLFWRFEYKDYESMPLF